MYRAMDIGDNLLLDRASSSHVSTQTLKLAEYLGSPFGKEKIDIDNGETNIDFTEWIWRLYQWKKPMLVRACYTVTRATMPILEKIIRRAILITDNYWQKEAFLEIISNVKSAINLTERWLLYQDNSTIDDAHKMGLKLKEIVEMLTLWCYEFGGVDETKIVYILNTALNTLSAVTWDYKNLSTDLQRKVDDESVANIIYGPIVETLQAIDYARLALDINEDEMKRLFNLMI